MLRGRPVGGRAAVLEPQRDGDDQDCSDGLAEDVVNALARLPGLRVAFRTTSFRFRGQNFDRARHDPAIGRLLDRIFDRARPAG